MKAVWLFVVVVGVLLVVQKVGGASAIQSLGPVFIVALLPLGLVVWIVWWIFTR